MSRILIIVDKLGWSYDAIARGLVSSVHRDDLSFTIVPLEGGLEYIEREHDSYDLVMAMGWTLVMAKKPKHRYRHELTFLDRRKLVAGIHSHRSWDGYTSLPDACPAPPAELIDQLSKMRGVNAISRRLFNLFRDAGLTNVVLTENGVDTDLFTPTRPISTDRQRPLVVGFCGSTNIDKHDHLKGYSEFIAPLQDIHNVEVKVLGGKGDQRVRREDMPNLYNQIDLYICASTSEGFSQSVLEASSCGRGVISTRVGGCEDLITEEYNGFFIERDLPAIKHLVSRLEADRVLVRRLGEHNRQCIVERYAWTIQGSVWMEFIEATLKECIGLV